MFLRAVIGAAVLSLLAQTAMARGGAGAHGSSGHGFHWGHMVPHGAMHRPGSHRAEHRDRSREKNAHRGERDRHADADGTWHRSPGFGDRRKSSRTDGEWHLDEQAR